MVKMKEYTAIYAGIDVSKAHLDVYLHPEGSRRRFNNDKTGHRALRSWLTKASPDGVVYEATGHYHKGVERYLGGHGFAIARLDARRARRFAEAIGVNAKTDPIDARMLARFGAYLKLPAIVVPEPALEQLKELVAARRSLVAQRTRIANRRKIVASPLLKRQLRQSAEQVARQIARIDAECHVQAMADPGLARRLAILLSITAIGDVTAMTLLADMPELGSLNDKQAASLMGVAPVARDSGMFRGKRHIRGGRAQVRKAVYMAALVATRFNADMKRKYQSLIENGKPPKLALTAIMRKLIILANALIRDDRMWTESRPCS